MVLSTRRFLILLILPLFALPSKANESLLGIEDTAWKDRVTLQLCIHLQRENHRLPEYLSVKAIQNLVNDAYEASVYNPSWGHERDLITIRHLVSAYGESYLKPDAINYRNHDGSIDMGIEQVNSCHWYPGYGTTDWQEFCEEQHLDDKKLNLLLDPKINMKFAAWVNELTMKQHHASYHFMDKPGKKRLYLELLKAARPLETAEKK